MPLSDCGAISSSWLSFLSSDILACYERSFHLSRCLKEWVQLYLPNYASAIVTTNEVVESIASL